jgi:hypothetical protein
MFKKSLKYFLIATINGIILTVMLALWTDKLELFFNDWVRQKEFLKIVGVCLLSLIGMRALVTYFRRKKITLPGYKVKTAALTTVLISSYLYINYPIKIINNTIVQREFRQQLALKIKPSNFLANGTDGKNLTIKEYQQITKMNWFPAIPAEAANINYTYDYDGFLPDYSFSLTYDLPIQVPVDTLNYKNGSFSKYQSFMTIDKIKRVTYTESLQ